MVKREDRELTMMVAPTLRQPLLERRGVKVSGALIGPMDVEDAGVLRLPTELIVHSVDYGSPADALGLVASDVIQSIDGRHFEDLVALVDYLDQRPAAVQTVFRSLNRQGPRLFDFHVRELPVRDVQIIGPESVPVLSP